MHARASVHEVDNGLQRLCGPVSAAGLPAKTVYSRRAHPSEVSGGRCGTQAVLKLKVIP